MNNLEIKLSNGVLMPGIGFGVYQIEPGKETQNAVRVALDTGYRMIDTAQGYFNEESVGKAVAESEISRDKLFIVTKVWITNCGEASAYESILRSLKKLRTDYIDLLLIHQPFGDYYGTYRAMEKAYAEGKVRAIGVSNFYPDRFVDICNFVDIKPMVNQVETHVFNQQKQARVVMQKYNCQIMSWGPFAEGKNNLFNNETLVKIGTKYKKSSAQVALRFLIQEGVVIIPKSVRKERIEENFNVADFSLSGEDMSEIRNLDQGRSLFLDHYDPDTVDFIIHFIKECK